ncbi:MAG: enoyl-CoA hydratase/isomerase family protein [Chloroflexi bacterium]|nr:enoyl-CoA hydratase/isomerase family protein [Chloroflexota bacterium]
MAIRPDSPSILYQVSQGIATITLNRPGALNATIPSMRYDWARALEQAQSDDEVRVVVVTGAGRAFSSGADLRSPEQPRITPDESSRQVILACLALDKPYLAAVNGPCAGGSLDYLCLFDIRIASDRATFATAYVRLGLIPSAAGWYFLPRLIGYSRAAELLWTGRLLDAQEADRIGLVDRVVPHGELMPATMDLAQRLAQGAPLAIRQSKRLLLRYQDMTLEESFDRGHEIDRVLEQGQDAQEARQAWLEKREPRFRGR